MSNEQTEIEFLRKRVQELQRQVDDDQGKIVYLIEELTALKAMVSPEPTTETKGMSSQKLICEGSGAQDKLNGKAE